MVTLHGVIIQAINYKTHVIKGALSQQLRTIIVHSSNSAVIIVCINMTSNAYTIHTACFCYMILCVGSQTSDCLLFIYMGSALLILLPGTHLRSRSAPL